MKYPGETYDFIQNIQGFPYLVSSVIVCICSSEQLYQQLVFYAFFFFLIISSSPLIYNNASVIKMEMFV